VCTSEICQGGACTHPPGNQNGPCPDEPDCCGAGCCNPDQTCCNNVCGLKGACCFFDTGSCSEKTAFCCQQEGGTYQGNGTTCTPGDLCRPKCENCYTVSSALYECHHWANDPNGASCSTIECIQNALSTATCIHYPARVGPSTCENQSTAGGMVVQTIHSNSCSGGIVLWSPWHTIHYTDCSSGCSEPFNSACHTSNCPGPLIRGPFNRGTKKVCGCP